MCDGWFEQGRCSLWRIGVNLIATWLRVIWSVSLPLGKLPDFKNWSAFILCFRRLLNSNYCIEVQKLQKSHHVDHPYPFSFILYQRISDVVGNARTVHDSNASLPNVAMTNKSVLVTIGLSV